MIDVARERPPTEKTKVERKPASWHFRLRSPGPLPTPGLAQWIGDVVKLFMAKSPSNVFNYLRQKRA